MIVRFYEQCQRVIIAYVAIDGFSTELPSTFELQKNLPPLLPENHCNSNLQKGAVIADT
jgi:hypothetical protein